MRAALITLVLAVAPTGVTGFGVAVHASRFAAVPRCTPVDATATVAGRGLRRIVSLPGAAVRSIWQRCTPDSCAVGVPRPIEWVRSLVPQRRPLSRLGHNECSSGVYKVERRESERLIRLYPVKRAADECTIDAMDMF